MLINFSFSNYRSFRDEQAFSMIRDSRFIDDGMGNISTLAAVYGANASGKSNFLRALHAMCNMVRTSYSQGDSTSRMPYYDPFAFRSGKNVEESEFFAEFIADDGRKYQYWFRCTAESILHEELLVYQMIGDRLSTRGSRLFMRDENGLRFGSSFRGPRAQVETTIGLRPNALVLSAAAAAGIVCTQPAFDFFAKDTMFCDAGAFDAEQPFILEQFNQKNIFARNLAKLIRYADFGIEDVRSAPVHINQEVLEAFKNQLGEELGASPEKLDRFFDARQGTVLQFKHVGEGTSAMFDIGHESKGTVAALSFFSLALRSLSRRTLILVDEIDTSLHPILVKELVSLYADPETNPHHSQLIFTTHDTSLITTSGGDERIINPDQMWLVEKNASGASDLYPVTDLHIRKGENIGKNYLNGVYGATPYPSFHTVFGRIINGDGNDK